MDGVRKILILSVAALAAGCSRAPDLPFPNWLAQSRSARVSEGSEAAAKVLRAADMAEREAGSYARRVWFSPAQKTNLMARLEPSLMLALEASRGRTEMPGRAQSPAGFLPGQNGLRLMGHALVWRIERSAAMEQFGRASSETIQAVRFGLALLGGSASDADLGFTVIERACSALAPVAGELSASELRSLGLGLEAALRNRPEASGLIENERAAMLEAVQAIQDAYRDRSLYSLQKSLGRDSAPAFDHLSKLESKGADARSAYFLGFAEEAEIWADHYAAAFQRSASQRARLEEPRLAENRPWRRFSRHYFRTLEPLLAVRDEALGRLRLMGLSALLLADCKANGLAPSTLMGISEELKRDPYSGQDLLYRPDGPRFLLYSVGADLKDDGGETNETGRSPDMRILEFSG